MMLHAAARAVMLDGLKRAGRASEADAAVPTEADVDVARAAVIAFLGCLRPDAFADAKEGFIGRMLLVTLAIDIVDLDENERIALAQDMETTADKLPRRKDHASHEIAALFNGLRGPDLNQLLFEGSDVFVEVNEMRAVGHCWVDAEV